MDTYIVNEFPIISELENPWRTHFGVVPSYNHLNDRRRPIIDCGFNEDDSPRRHDDPCHETMLWRAPGVTAWVSGSWPCWGPQDQETQGDDSLHVVVFTAEKPTEKQLNEFYDSLALDVHDGEGTLLAHAFITRRDDSEIFSVVTFSTTNQASIFDLPREETSETEEETYLEDSTNDHAEPEETHQVDMTFTSLVETEEVTRRLRQMVACYGEVTVSDFAELLGLPFKREYSRWGWRNLTEMRVVCEGRYLRLVIPPAVKL